MKTKFLYALMIWATAYTANAQDYFFMHGDFELWSSTSGYSEPRGWFTLNPLSSFGFPESTIMTSESHSGQSAALLVSKENVFQDIPGLLTSGSILDQTGNPDLSLAKIPFAYRPKNFSFYYKAMPAPGDSCSGIMVLTRWNIAEQRTDTVGLATFVFADSVTTYTRHVAEFEYFSPLMPDSVVLIIASSFDGFAPTPGSTLYIDDFSLGFETGIGTTESLLDHVAVYPNPVSDNLTIQTEENTYEVRLFDLQGRKIYQANAEQTLHQVNVQGYTPGIYLLEVRSVNGVSRQKVVINQ